MDKALYTKIEIFKVKAVCKGPLHVGDAEAGNESILVHPVKLVPVIQASSLAGAFRAYDEKSRGIKETARFFGGSSGSDSKTGLTETLDLDENTNEASELIPNAADTEFESHIRFSDAFFDMEKLGMEIRPRVSIDPVTGTVNSSTVKGSSVESGHKFEMEHVGIGSEFDFEIGTTGDVFYKNRVLRCLRALDNGDIVIGGQKSQGGGKVGIKSVQYFSCDLTDTNERRSWLEDHPSFQPISLEDISDDEKDDERNSLAYKLILEGNTEGELLIKDIVPEGLGAGSADAINIKNAKSEYIIPGSSIKGVLKNRMSMIAGFMGVAEVIDYAFGASVDGKTQRSGNLRTEDIVVSPAKDPANEGITEKDNEGDVSGFHGPLRTRIHINKFTGGVMRGALFSERNVHGKICMNFSVLKDEHADQTMGLLIFALRDLSAKAFQIGSGYSIGKGYIDVSSLKVYDGVEDKKDMLVEMDFKKDEAGRACGMEIAKNKDDILSVWLNSLKKEAGNGEK